MASQYFALLTDYGKQAFAKALSSQQPMQLATFAVGDGNGQNVTPTANQTALAREKYRAAVSAVSLDPRNNKQVIVELTMPENVGGFYIREMGVFDNQNKLVAYANCPESFKPTLESGTGKVQVLRMILQVASSAAVALSVDHSVIFVTRQQHTPKTITATTANGFDETGHTHQIDKASLTQQGIVQLNSATNSDNETMAATPKAVKTAYDLANGKQSPATTLAGYGIGNFKVEPFVGNLNTLKTDGVYAITQASRSQNLPVSTSCQIEVIAGGDGAWCRQLAYVAYSTDVYERHQTSYQTDSWSPWVKIDSLDKIPNSKKSSAVDSNSADTVATSAAVKIAYDKGVEAKNAADGAQSTANDGVAKAKTAQAAAEAAQRTANDGVSKATTAQNTANSAVTKADNAQRAADNANNNANNRVSKSGDTMTGNLTVPNLIVNDPTNNNNFVQIGDDTKLIDVDISHTVGLQTTNNANDAYIAYGATKKRFGFDGNMFFADSALATNYIGHGSYAQQYNVAAPFYVHQTLSVAAHTYHPFVKGRVRAAGQYGAAFSFGYVTNQRQDGDGYGAGIIHLISDAGNDRLWQFAHNGEFVSAGDVLTGAGRSLNNAIYREGNPHDIALSWQSDGLKVRVDNVDIGRVAYKSDLTSKVDVSQIDAGNRYIRVQGSLLVISGGTAGGTGQSGSVYNAFPISFPNVCVAVIPVHVGTDQTTNIIIESGSVTKYGFKAKTSHRLNAAIDYIAFGY